MEDSTARANTAVEEMKPASPPVERLEGAVDGVNAMVDRTTFIVNTWEPLLEKIEQFTKIVDQISEV